MSSTTLIRRLDPAQPPPPARTADGLGGLLAVMWRRRLLVLTVVLLVAATVGIGLSVAERTYTAQARVAVVPDSETGPTGTEYEAMQRTVADVATSRPVLAQVQELGDGRGLTALRDQVASGAVTGTVLVQVSVDDADPQRAADLANGIVRVLPQFDPSNGTVRYEVTENASVPARPSSPNVPVTLLAGGALALGLAVAVAVAYDRVARTVTTPDDLTAAGTRVLGVVGPPGDLQALPALDAGTERFADLRALRVALEFASVDDHTRTLVVAGTAPGPHNGWLAANLAIALAGVGHHVLLVDADPSPDARRVGAEQESPGLYDVLSGDAGFDTAIRPGPASGVDVLPIGNADQAAPSLLEMRFRRLLDDVAVAADDLGDGEQPLGLPHDVVVVSAPPVTTSDDARVIAVDGGLLITVPTGRVKPSVLDDALAALRGGRTRVLGTVLVDAR